MLGGLSNIAQRRWRLKISATQWIVFGMIFLGWCSARFFFALYPMPLVRKKKCVFYLALVFSIVGFHPIALSAVY